MMRGQATKQRLHLIKAFILAMEQFSPVNQKTEESIADANSNGLAKTVEMIRSMALELIQSISNSNLKIRKLAEESFDVI